MRCCRTVSSNTRSSNDDKYSNEKCPSIAIIPQAKNRLTHSHSSESNFYIYPERGETTTLYLNDFTKCPINRSDKNIDDHRTRINDADENETTTRSLNKSSSRHSFRPIECEDESSRMNNLICQRQVLLTTPHEYSHAICNPLAQIPCRHTSPTVRKSVR